MSETQPSLFSTRQTRRLWLERLVLPRFTRSDGSVGRTNTLKHFLRVIESHSPSGGPSYLKVGTISHEMGVSERTVFRHIADSTSLGLITVRPAQGDASEYEIDWTAVAQAILDCPKTTNLIDQSQNYRTAEVTNTYPQSGTPDNLANTPDNLARGYDILTPTPDNLSSVDGERTSLTRVRLKPCFKPSSNHETKPSCGDDALKMKSGGSGFSGWPFMITAEHLSRPASVQQLWEHALERGFVGEHHRTNFFVLALWVAEFRDPQGQPFRSPGGKFTTQLKQSVASGHWFGSDGQEKRVEAALRKLDDRDDGRTSNLDECRNQDEKIRQMKNDLKRHMQKAR